MAPSGNNQNTDEVNKSELVFCRNTNSCDKLLTDDNMPSFKHDRNGQAAILTIEQIEEIFTDLEVRFSPRHKLLFAICYYTGCRISEALKLSPKDVTSGYIFFKARTTKTKNSRQVKISPKLQEIIDSVGASANKKYLFPGRTGNAPMTSQAADKALRVICDYCGFKGVSTHSFRRSVITHLHEKGAPIKAIQEFTGHKSLESLSKYVECSQETSDKVVDLI